MTRVLSAAVLIALVLGAVWLLPPWATTALAAVAAGLAAAELAGLARAAGARLPAWIGAVAAALVAVAVPVDTVAPAPGGPPALAALLLAAIVALGAVTLGSGPPGPGTIAGAAVAFMAPVYVGLPLGALAAIRAADGPGVLTLLFAIVAVSDSAQYYTGRLAGRRKLAPVVSPGKTVEGAVGGLVAAAVTGAVAGPIWLVAVGPLSGALLGVALASAGILGDLFESLLKRSAGAKDSSVLIPGHGGALDRLDSYLFAAPLFYLFLRLAG